MDKQITLDDIANLYHETKNDNGNFMPIRNLYLEDAQIYGSFDRPLIILQDFLRLVNLKDYDVTEFRDIETIQDNNFTMITKYGMIRIVYTPENNICQDLVDKIMLFIDNLRKYSDIKRKYSFELVKNSMEKELEEKINKIKIAEKERDLAKLLNEESKKALKISTIKARKNINNALDGLRPRCTSTTKNLTIFPINDVHLETGQKCLSVSIVYWANTGDGCIEDDTEDEQQVINLRIVNKEHLDCFFNEIKKFKAYKKNDPTFANLFNGMDKYLISKLNIYKAYEKILFDMVSD